MHHRVITSVYHSEHLSSLWSPNIFQEASLYKRNFLCYETCLPKADAITQFSSFPCNYSIGKALPIKSKFNFGLKGDNMRKYVPKESKNDGGGTFLGEQQCQNFWNPGISRSSQDLLWGCAMLWSRCFCRLRGPQWPLFSPHKNSGG